METQQKFRIPVVFVEGLPSTSKTLSLTTRRLQNRRILARPSRLPIIVRLSRKRVLFVSEQTTETT